jgi:hypothetical protein
MQKPMANQGGSSTPTPGPVCNGQSAWLERMTLVAWKMENNKAQVTSSTFKFCSTSVTIDCGKLQKN